MTNWTGSGKPPPFYVSDPYVSLGGAILPAGSPKTASRR